MDPTTPARAATAADPARRAARQFEAAFAAEMIRAARPPRREGSLGSGARDFDNFMDEALGKALADRGTLRLEQPIADAIRKTQRARTNQP
ncbi:hypothetical protein [Paracraurococcus ruber]|uniref:Flagellar protein FlgJ N-terminal domain-containing protein n=1 Tax=Paracraurococcus ruber TaxID=77675 RepID=A0ABS1CQR5_9PROT|nr:hypothetical protein [Paracraurococcus ruber]MBK1656626.1 hypothetical protein [Paracraurococcus ruber]MBK1656680.1 hypothetical protein [Paracraurococcus ruber]TDG33700.1 hypothetical protein E2C05_02445 [Paracraurococcus ruber]TDG33750.1 hypothetical protein E2C05_02730 [Paracraurococcus ruber]